MPKQLFIAIIVGLFYCSSVYAQVDYPYLKPSEYVEIPVSKKAVLYNSPLLKSWINDSSPKYVRKEIVSLEHRTTAKVPRNAKVLLAGFARQARSFPYTLYVVSVQDEYYYLKPEDCLDNSFIDNKNWEMDQYLKQLQRQRREKIEELNYSASIKKQELEKLLVENERKQKNINYIVDSIWTAQTTQREEKYKKELQEWQESLPASAQKAANIISITNSHLTSPNSVGGCGYGFGFYNNNPTKTIKYITWTGNVYNAVNDKVSCDIRDQYTFSGTITGPIAPFEHGEGGWDDIIYNYTAREMRLTSIVVQYMDGSKASIKGADIYAIMNCPRKEVPSYNARDTYALKLQLQSDLDREATRLSNRIKYTENPLYRSYALDTKYFAEELKLLDEIAALEKEIRSFAFNNYVAIDF